MEAVPQIQSLLRFILEHKERCGRFEDSGRGFTERRSYSQTDKVTGLAELCC
jgi:hypothetical protein